ncbi:hypothetical protein [Methylobacterium indicum]|uniref:hypothetical protein n=1 Tax=Methylobacterium indicum TaxID=1775910 RepID=UPI002434AE05|nr:hypothetical protein [Methylobacterium indicum]
MTNEEFENVLRATGVDPMKVARLHRPDQHQQQMAIDAAIDHQTVYPLVTPLTNRTNVNNGYTPDGCAISCVPKEFPATAIEKNNTSNGGLPPFATSDGATNDQLHPTDQDNERPPELAEVGAADETMPEPFYVKVDLFDNGAGRAGKKKGNRYKVKIHIRFEDKGQEFSYLGAFHPTARGFRHNVPEGYEDDPFYVEIDHAIDKASLSGGNWLISPIGAKFKDSDNKVMIYTAAILFWEAGQDHPTIFLHLQGWGFEATLDLKPQGRQRNNNLLAYCVWLNQDKLPEKKVFEEKRGGNTLMETMRLQRQGIKK